MLWHALTCWLRKNLAWVLWACLILPVGTIRQTSYTKTSIKTSPWCNSWLYNSKMTHKLWGDKDKKVVVSRLVSIDEHGIFFISNIAKSLATKLKTVYWTPAHTSQLQTWRLRLAAKVRKLQVKALLQQTSELCIAASLFPPILLSRPRSWDDQSEVVAHPLIRGKLLCFSLQISSAKVQHFFSQWSWRIECAGYRHWGLKWDCSRNIKLAFWFQRKTITNRLLAHVFSDKKK